MILKACEINLLNYLRYSPLGGRQRSALRILWFQFCRMLRLLPPPCGPSRRARATISAATALRAARGRLLALHL
jgi:hypothetical protein